jgi:catechol-2,3-dioxygenase
MAEPAKPRAIGLNHIALEVGDIEEALAFYGRLFEFKLRGKNDRMAFIDLGDQFIALQKGRKQPTTMVVISVSLLMIRKPPVARFMLPASHSSMDLSSTSAIPGATALRSLIMRIFNSLKRQMSYAAWASTI